MGAAKAAPHESIHRTPSIPYPYPQALSPDSQTGAQDEAQTAHAPVALPHAEHSPSVAVAEAQTVAESTVPAVVEDEEQAWV